MYASPFLRLLESSDMAVLEGKLQMFPPHFITHLLPFQVHILLNVMLQKIYSAPPPLGFQFSEHYLLCNWYSCFLSVWFLY